MIVSNSSSVFPFSWGIWYYAMMFGTLLMILSKGISKSNGVMLMLYAIAAVSILANDIPALFKPWQRLGTFILLTAVVSPMFISKWNAGLRVQLFTGMTILLAIITAVSIIMLGLGMGRDSVQGWFEGAMKHSMLMGPVAAVSSLFCLYQLQYTVRKKWIKWVYYIMIGGGLLCVLQTGSRAALIGTIISLLAFPYFRNRQHFDKMIKKYLLVFILVLASFPIWNRYTDKIREKNKTEITELNVDSRLGHWQQRIIEWESSPLYGIGFGSVDAESENSTINVETGGVETGSSWLCALSMTGILGFLCVLGIFIGAFSRAWKMTYYSSATGSFLLSIMIFYIFHMMAEGYIFAGGNFLNTQLWLLIGTVYSITEYPEYGQILEDKLQLHL